MRTSEPREKRNEKLARAKKIAKYTLLSIAGAGVLLLIFGVYVSRSFTWKDVYSTLGLGGASPSASAQEKPDAQQLEEQQPAEPVEIIEGELEGDAAEVCFVSVGQGDCTVIRAGGQTAIIDAGDDDSADSIRRYLKGNDITKVDILFASHPHVDHIGSMHVILNSCEVSRCVMTHYSDELAPTNYTYMSFLKQLAAKGVPTSLAGDAEVFELGGGSITALFSGGLDTLNDCSLILRFDYGESSFLFMGDAGFEPERALLASGAKLQSDVLKVGHHGSRYATSGAFLAAVSPRFAVISCGRDNQYGYPAPDVLNLLEKRNVTTLRTDEDGDVTFLTDGKIINVKMSGGVGSEIQR